MTFDWEFAISILPILVDGAKLTFVATCAGFALAAVWGLLLAVARMSPLRPIRWPASAYVEFIRDTPLLIQLFFLFYVLPYLGVSLPALTTGILGLGLNYSAYLSEVYRAGIEGVARGQWEAARALSLPGGVTWRRVILPQAIPPVILMLGNYLIAMFKDSMLLGTITVLELFGRTTQVGATTYRFLEPFTLLGILVLLLSLAGSFLVNRVAARFA